MPCPFSKRFDIVTGNGCLDALGAGFQADDVNGEGG